MTELNCKMKSFLYQDTKFLINHGFLDYSLLLAIEIQMEPKSNISDKKISDQSNELQYSNNVDNIGSTDTLDLHEEKIDRSADDFALLPD